MLHLNVTDIPFASREKNNEHILTLFLELTSTLSEMSFLTLSTLFFLAASCRWISLRNTAKITVYNTSAHTHLHLELINNQGFAYILLHGCFFPFRMVNALLLRTNKVIARHTISKVFVKTPIVILRYVAKYCVFECLTYHTLIHLSDYLHEGIMQILTQFYHLNWFFSCTYLMHLAYCVHAELFRYLYITH